MSASSDAVSVLRAHDPAQHLEPLSPDSRETLRDRVLSTAAHTCPAVRPAPRRRRAISLALAAVGALVVGVGAAWAAGALSPTAIFLNSPQQQDVAPGSLWDQHVVPSSVVQASTVDIPKVGRVGFWFARTEEGGCRRSASQTARGWEPSRTPGTPAALPPDASPPGQLSTTPVPGLVYELDGFDYQEALVDARADGGLVWHPIRRDRRAWSRQGRRHGVREIGAGRRRTSLRSGDRGSASGVRDEDSPGRLRREREHRRRRPTEPLERAEEDAPA